jgi:ribonuclease T2
MLRSITRLPASLFRHALIGLALFAAVAIALQGAAAQDRSVNRYGDPVTTQDRGRNAPQGEPGKFDFYVLALSWSPSFCEVSRERYSDRRPDPQCAGRPYAFVVHGLWPQYERGFPSNCQVPSPRLSRTIVDQMLELMPSPRLVYHEWDRHGTCTGLGANGYFDTVRAARGKIVIPNEYRELAGVREVSPNEVAEAFVAANPGLRREAFAVTCDDKRLTGIRICMGKDLAFRDCSEIARRACTRDRVVMPPMRGGRAADAR